MASQLLLLVIEHSLGNDAHLRAELRVFHQWEWVLGAFGEVRRVDRRAVRRGWRTDIALFVAFRNQLAAEKFASLFDGLLTVSTALDHGLLNGEFGHHGVLITFRLLAEREQVR